MTVFNWVLKISVISQDLWLEHLHMGSPYDFDEGLSFIKPQFLHLQNGDRNP